LAEGLRRGDIVVVAIPGEYGKPRPAVVVQSDFLSGQSDGVIVCPITSRLVDAERTRPRLHPDDQNGLRRPSQVMSDKVTTVHLRKVGSRIGRVTVDDLQKIDFSLSLVLGFLD
jgi:mRNA interferase MazF